MEREVRVFMQNERQRVHGRTRSMHFKDICEKGESKLTLRCEHRRAGKRKERKTEIFLNFCFHKRFTLHSHSHARNTTEQ